MRHTVILFLLLAASSHAEVPAKSNFGQIEFNCVDRYTRQASDYRVLLTASQLKNQDGDGNPDPELWSGTSKVIVSKGLQEVMTIACADWGIVPLGPGDRPGQRNCEQRNSAGQLVHKFFLILRDVTWELSQQFPFGTGILIIENREGGIFECLPSLNVYER